MTRSISSYLPIYRRAILAAAVFSFLILLGNSAFAKAATLPPGLCPGGAGVVGGNAFTDYDIVVGHNQFDIATITSPAYLIQNELTILVGTTIDPPTDVKGYDICIGEAVPFGEGLAADCGTTCSPISIQRVTWWTAAQGGIQVGTGSSFDPVTAGAVDNSVAGTTTFYAQCECDVCVSDRVPADFIVNPFPSTIIDGSEFVCPGEMSVYTLQTQVGNDVGWTVSSGGTIINENDTELTVLWSSMQGTGPFSVTATETTTFGCEDSDTAEVLISNTTIACNDSVQVSLDATGCAIIRPDQILEGTYNNFENFTIEITANGVVIGDKVDCSHIGGNFTVNVIGECDQNSCWSTILVEDKLPPVIDCPDMNDEIVLDCTMDIDAVVPPTATDNCSIPDVRLIGEEKNDSDCSEITVKRTWIAFDDEGLESAPCMQFIRLLAPEDPQFPDDVTWTCEQYALFPNIIDATALHPYILQNAAAIDAAAMSCTNSMTGDDVPFIEPYHSIYRYWKDAEDLDVSLDPYYDDVIDNDFTDPVPNQIDFSVFPFDTVVSTFGTISPELDTRPNTYNTSLGLCPRYDTVIDRSTHIPTKIVYPIFRQSTPSGNPLNGLEDADILAMTGSGIPDLSEGYCPFVITHSDQIAEVCPGADTSAIFKIFRTWTALNWCTGEIFTDLQVIKVVDKLAPVIEAEPIEVDANITIQNVHADEVNCGSTGFIPGPNVTDNCSTVTFVKILTPIGEAVYLNGFDGTDGGTIPAPGLGFGTHQITYIATDACGNSSQETVELTVTDYETPTMICREFTSVSLSFDDWAKVCATDLDEASFDNCGIDTFLIKRMDEPDSLFRECVDLTCVDTSFTAVVRAYDFAGNRNQCMVEVTVNDKLRPECYAPEDVWTTCVEIPNYYDLTDTVRLNELFGTATFYDNCNAQILELAPEVDLDMCGVGTITRNWRATDPSGNQSTNRCRQTIMVQSVNDYKINFPADWTGECGDMEDAETVTFINRACDQLTYDVEDLRFDISDDGACYKIIRTYTVLNWCSYDGVSSAIVVPHDEDGIMVLSEDDDAHGFYTYKQLIVVKDDEAPIVSYDGDTEFCSTNASCDAPVNITIDYDDGCTNDITVRWRLDVNCDGTTDSEGFNAFDRTVPIGQHCITFSVIDGCGNTGIYSVDFDVKDCKKPTPVCHNGLSAELDLNGEIEIWANDFDAGSFDYCNLDPLKFRANNIDDINGDGFVTTDDYRVIVPTTSNVLLTCDDLGIQMVQMWVGDDYDNWDYCVTFVEVQDNMSFCGRNSKMGGKIATAQGRSVMDVNVELSGDQLQSLMTDASGMFEFGNVPLGGDYSVTPVKNTNPNNGVSTFDIYLISRHLLNVERFDSPYKIIAADANRSGSVSTLDIVELRKMILYIQSGFNNNTSWRFVDKNHIFVDPSNPFATGFPEIVNYNNLAANELNANFVAIKIGDVNGDATTNNIQSIDGRTNVDPQIVSAENQSLSENELATVRFDLADAENLLGYQFTLEFDPTLVEFEDIIENDFVKESNFGFTLLDEGIITASWNKTSVAPTDLFFDLVFRASGKAELKEALKINSRYTRAEAFDTAGDLKNVELRFDGIEITGTDFSLHQNKPNPFSDGTLIGFDLPEASAATLTVFDLSGKVVKLVQKDFPQGYNEITITKDELNGTGVYYYRLETAHDAATRKMMFLE